MNKASQHITHDQLLFLFLLILQENARTLTGNLDFIFPSAMIITGRDNWENGRVSHYFLKERFSEVLCYGSVFSLLPLLYISIKFVLVKEKPSPQNNHKIISKIMKLAQCCHTIWFAIWYLRLMGVVGSCFQVLLPYRPFSFLSLNESWIEICLSTLTAELGL